jgi:hypothetical protein
LTHITDDKLKETKIRDVAGVAKKIWLGWWEKMKVIITKVKIESLLFMHRMREEQEYE